jgi:hypothetical protein
MKQKERFQRIRKAFKKLIKDGKEGAFVIFANPKTSKFYQFAYEFEEKVFVCDIPLAELN